MSNLLTSYVKRRIGTDLSVPQMYLILGTDPGELVEVTRKRSSSCRASLCGSPIVLTNEPPVRGIIAQMYFPALPSLAALAVEIAPPTP